MEISEITDRNSLKAWLEDKPLVWSQAIAARAALRAAPVAFSVAGLPEARLERKHQENLILSTFRALFISSIGNKHPARDIRAVTRATSDAGNAVLPIARTARDTAFALKVLKAGAAANSAAAAVATSSADNNTTASTGANAAVISAINSAADAADAVWQVVRTDCIGLQQDFELRADRKSEPAEQARALMMQPIWMVQDEAGNFIQEPMPNALVKAFDDFQTSKLAQETSFGLIVDWYIAALEGKSAFGESAELAIAKMSPKDWGDEDKERDCIAVMGRVAELAGWRMRTTVEAAEWDFFLSYNENDEAIAKRISTILEGEGYSVFSQFNDMTAGKSFVQEMNKGLSGMGKLIAVYSPDYFSSGACMSEWEAAYLTDPSGKDGKIVPFVVRSCAPPPLAKRLVWENLMGLDPAKEKEAILRAIRGGDIPKTRVEQRKALKMATSPDVQLDKSGNMLDAVPNAEFDKPFVEEDLLDLPEILKSLISTILAGLENTNCRPTIKQALKEYQRELDARGPNCILGRLKAQMGIIQSGLDDPTSEFWLTDNALVQAFDNFSTYHSQLITHYPMDSQRQRLLNAIHVEPEKLDLEAFETFKRDITSKIEQAKEEGTVSDRYQEISDSQLSAARDALSVETPAFEPSGDHDFDLNERERIERIKDHKKKRVTEVVGTIDKSLDIMSKVAKLAESETAGRMADAFRRLVDWFW